MVTTLYKHTQMATEIFSLSLSFLVRFEMEKDTRYQWIESRIITTIEPKRDALIQLIQNDDNRLSIEQFLENEDITHLYILSQSSSTNLLATNIIPVDFNSFDKIVLFIKTNLTSKLTRENLGLFSS